MRDLHSLQPATRADWFGLAKVAMLMDMAILAGALVAFTLGGHA